VVISRRLGRRAMEKFSKFRIDVWKADNSSTVQETLNKFIIGGFFVRQRPEGCEYPIA
jgi:predicted Fe-Mo cluster-binding NifX family protein